jgi:hypothetical protein
MLFSQTRTLPKVVPSSQGSTLNTANVIATSELRVAVIVILIVEQKVEQ